MKNCSSHGTISLIKAVRDYGLLITDFLIVPTVLTNSYQDLTKLYPKAKIILSVRDSDDA